MVGGSVPAVHDGWMWDLTVPGNNDHDFYVPPAEDGSGAYYRVDQTGVTAVLVHNASGCVLAYKQARDLAATREDPENSTVAVAHVRSTADPNVTDTWVATERSGLPDEWKGAGSPQINARYILGEGHAEDTIMNSLGDDWELVNLASSTRMCQDCLDGALDLGLETTGIGIGDPEIETGNTVYRTVTRRN